MGRAGREQSEAAETLGGLTTRAPQLMALGPELGLQEGCGWRATVLWTQPVTLTQAYAGPSCEVTEKGKKRSQDRTDSVILTNLSYHLPSPSRAGFGCSLIVRLPADLPCHMRDTADALCAGKAWQPLPVLLLKASMGGKALLREPRGWREARAGKDAHPTEKPALWLGLKVAAEVGAARGRRQERCRLAAHTFPSSPAPHALASSVETF